MMKLTVDSNAAAWFKEEVGIPEGTGIRFKAKIYSDSPVREGFGIALESDKPSNLAPVTFTSDNGLVFFIEEDDLWFFDGHDLKVELHETLNEPHYRYYLDGKAIN